MSKTPATKKPSSKTEATNTSTKITFKGDAVDVPTRPTGPRSGQPKQEPFRPSDIPPVDGRISISNPLGDPAKWLREHGKPNPVRLYSVTAKRGKTRLDGLEINAVDETSAFNEFVRRNGLKEPHRYIFRAIMLKE